MNARLTTVLACAAAAAMLSCKGGDSPPRPWFEEEAAASGLDFVHDSGHRDLFLMPEVVSGGAALFDADGDGDLDAYLVQSGRVVDAPELRPENRLYLNDGSGRFKDTTAESGTGDRGYGMGVACGDVDDDGDTDLYVTNLGPNTLFTNLGDARFHDATASSGTGDGSWGSSAAFFDHDLDGDLDLFVVNYIEWYVTAELDCRDMMGLADYCSPLNYDAPAADVLYENVGRGRFRDVSAASGVGSERGNGLGVAVFDHDDDGFPDVFVANDGEPDHLWRNGGDGAFANVALAAGCALDHEGAAKAGMGVSVADVDDDGDTDLIVCNRNRESDSFFVNDGGSFRDRGSSAGLRVVSRSFTRFGLGWVDFDQDGRLDLYEANGRVERQSIPYADDPFAEPNLVLAGRPDGTFVEVLPRGGTREPVSATSRAAAFGDVDGDGAVDVLVVNRDGPVHLFINRVPDRGHWAAFRVLEASGRDALGASVLASLGERTLRRDVRAASSYLASNDPRVHFGLGRARRIEGVRVRWADGAVERFGDFDEGSVHELRRGNGDREAP